MSQAAELLGVQAAFLRSLDSSGVARSPTAPPAATAATPATSSPSPPGCAASSTTGTPLASAETIVGLQDELASARADADRLRGTASPAAHRRQPPAGATPGRWRSKP